MNTDQTKTALITGASGAIGHEFCRHLAADQINLVLVGRSHSKLESLRRRLQDAFDIKVMVIIHDLAAADAAEQTYRQFQKLGVPVDYLINNAGIGFYGAFSNSTLADNTRMINLNITTLVQLTRLILPVMLKQGNGRILNVASLASFQPGGANAAVYYASKSFVLNFNRALTQELRNTPVTSTAFCPGPLTTSFSSTGGFDSTRLYRFFTGNIEKQVATAYHGLHKGRSVVVPGVVNKLLAIGGEIPPRAIALSLNTFLLNA